MFEPCLVVTSSGVYILKFARDPVTTFLECAMQVRVKYACHAQRKNKFTSLVVVVAVAKRFLSLCIRVYNLKQQREASYGKYWNVLILLFKCKENYSLSDASYSKAH